MTEPARLQPGDFEKAARSLGVEVASLRAVAEVESRGSGFLVDGRPIILYERHIMFKLMMAHDPAAATFERTTQPELVNIVPGGYKGGLVEWERLADAIAINRECALQSASWGLFQLMGFHWQRLGFKSVQAFVNAMYAGEPQQLDAFCRFICTDSNLHKALVSRDWLSFARGYNGKAQQGYDVKIANAYAKHSKLKENAP